MRSLVNLSISRWNRFGSDRDFYRFAERHLRAAFPALPNYSQFNRLLGASGNWLNSFNQFLLVSMQVQACVYEALDTMGCATRNSKRRREGWLAGEANIGYSNHLGWYEGLNVITSVTPDGFITGFGCAPASTKEQPYAETFLALRAAGALDLPEAGRPARGIYITDNGFCGKSNHHGNNTMRLGSLPHLSVVILSLGLNLYIAGWQACDRSLKRCMENSSILFGWSANIPIFCKVFAFVLLRVLFYTTYVSG